MPAPPHGSGLMRKFIRRSALSLLLLAVILFGAAGTIDWPQAWIYLALTAAMSFAGGYWLLGRDPGLLAERLALSSSASRRAGTSSSWC